MRCCVGVQLLQFTRAAMSAMVHLPPSLSQVEWCMVTVWMCGDGRNIFTWFLLMVMCLERSDLFSFSGSMSCLSGVDLNMSFTMRGTVLTLHSSTVAVGPLWCRSP